MNKVIKDGQEVIEWEEVDMSLHSAGNLGIGTQPTGNICFFGTHADSSTEVLRLSKDGIWANPDIPVDEAAKLVLAAIDHNIKVSVDKAILAEREACARVCEAEASRAKWNWDNDISGNQPFWNGGEQLASSCAAAIRARGQA